MLKNILVGNATIASTRSDSSSHRRICDGPDSAAPLNSGEPLRTIQRGHHPHVWAASWTPGGSETTSDRRRSLAGRARSVSSGEVLRFSPIPVTPSNQHHTAGSTYRSRRCGRRTDRRRGCRRDGCCRHPDPWRSCVGFADGVRLVVEFLPVQPQPGIGVTFEQAFFGDRQHAAGTGGRVVDGADGARFAGRRCPRQTADPPSTGSHRVGCSARRPPRWRPRRTVDQILEQITHLGVRYRIRMQVDLGELRGHQVQSLLLIQGGQLVLELEPLEHVDVRREPGDVVDQVGPQPLRIVEREEKSDGAGVVERQPGRASDLRQRPTGILLGQLADLVAGGFKDAVQAPQDRERQDHPAVLVRLVHPAELVGDTHTKLPSLLTDLAVVVTAAV